jgi:ribosomal protein L37AE/L43A
MKEKIKNISLCKYCNSMTHIVKDGSGIKRCSKCGAKK